MSSSGLPALVVPATDGSQDSTKNFDGKTEASKDEAEFKAESKISDSPRRQSGLKPPRGHCKPPGDSDEPWPAQAFRESLEKGVSIESGKRSVFGFGLSDDQEDALFQYITNKSSKRPPGYEPDREALADCWGSPEPERLDEDVEESEQPNVPGTLSPQLGPALQDGEVPVVSGDSCVANEEDVASTESLYEGEGGVDLGSRSPGGTDAHIGNNDGASDPTMSVDDDRVLIMEKVKECYGVGIRSSLERVMRKDLDEAVQSSSRNGNRTKTTLTKTVGGAGKMVRSPTSSELSDGDEINSNLWEDECIRYLERAPEFRARLQYEVRLILISPAFRLAGRTVTAFARLYEKKFGKTVESAAGFSTAARLCRSMPHVVQRTLLIDEGKLRLVDTPKNHRIVAGIRSGLRRIVYDVLRAAQHNGLTLEEVEGQCEEQLGRPLEEVLVEHGYGATSTTGECLLRDMPDIVILDERAAQTRAYLCNGAQDPALTDGILIPRTPTIATEGQATLSTATGDHQKQNIDSSFSNSKEKDLQDVEDPSLSRTPCGPRTGSNGMAPEELSDLRVLCAAESSSPCGDASVYSTEDMSPHVRLRFRLLLALHDEGRGIQVEDLPVMYEKMFGVPLDLPSLGMDSISELIDDWQHDVLLVKTSDPSRIFPINTLENNRILNTITSGLRSAVFAILLARYPEGLAPSELIECLEETLSGKFWEILNSNGYIIKSIDKSKVEMSKRGSEFQLAKCYELRLLLKDMEDFVRLGSQEDGVLIVKLRDGEFPLLDLLDCEVSKEPSLISEGGNFHSPNKEDILSDKEHVGKEVMELEDKPTLTSVEVDLGATTTTPKPSLKLQHEIRMILGSPLCMENGLTVEEFCIVYRDKTGKALQLGEFKSIEALLNAIPDIVDTQASEHLITLVQSRRNMRILSIAKVGLRQVLFWALLKNPSGIWAELLEGWYLDFAGWPLSNALAIHGYEKPQRAPLQPACEFLQDMGDLLMVDTEDPTLYVWRGFYEDPIIADAALLGISVESIQYDPMNEEMKHSHLLPRSLIAKKTLGFHTTTRVDYESTFQSNNQLRTSSTSKLNNKEECVDTSL